MKKTFALMLIIIGIFGTAFSESEFTFRNGISIGMSYEQIVEAEGKEPDGFTTDKWMPADEVQDAEYDLSKIREIQYNDVSFSRFTAECLYYSFSEQKLESAYYIFNDPLKGQIDYMIDAMSSVYGSAQMCSVNEAIYAIYRKAAEVGNSSYTYETYRWNVQDVNIYLLLMSRDEKSIREAYVIYAAAADCQYDITML